jgi:hypothetical protein
MTLICGEVNIYASKNQNYYAVHRINSGIIVKKNNDSFILEIYILFERALYFTKKIKARYLCDHERCDLKSCN